MLEIKITQIAAGFAALNTSKPIGSQASGDTGLNHADDGAGHLVEEVEATDHEAQRNADCSRHAEADADPLKRSQDVPAYTLIVRRIAVERVAEQHHRRIPGLDRAGQIRAG